MVNQQIFLPMIPDSAPIVINIAQYDYDAAGYAGRLYFNLISNGTAYDMNGATAVFQGEKPDGTTFAYAGTVVNASVVRVNVRQQMTTVAGRVVCNLVLNNSEGQIGSFNVWLEVQESATSGSTPSQTDIPALVAQAKQYADDAEQSAETAASYTGHPPYIGANNNWFVWDIDEEQFVDTEVEALGQGIVSIVKTSTSGLVDTYTITYTGGDTSTFNVTNGQDGTNGVGITSITKTGTSGSVDTYTILFTDGNETTFDVTNGTAPDITMTATADGTSSANPTVTVTKGGTLTNPTYALAFSGLKGEQGATGQTGATGATGNGIASITKTGTSGLVDTYTITYTNGQITTFTVTNGQNGTGAGDMLTTDYDPTLAVYNAGGIPSYVAAQIPAQVEVVDNLNSTSATKALSANQGHEISLALANKASTAVVSTTANGLAPKVTDTSKFLKGDGTWAKPTDTTYSVVSTSANGLAPQVTDTTKFLKGDGTWATPTDTTYSVVSKTANGLAPQLPNETTTTKFLRQDGSWSVPSYPSVNNGTLTIQQNSTNVQTFTANASSNATANIVTGEFIKTASVSSGSVTFTGINDTGTKGYDVFFDITSSSTNLSPYAKLTSITGEGTSSMSVTYETDADNGTNTAHLYQYK